MVPMAVVFTALHEDVDPTPANTTADGSGIHGAAGGTIAVAHDHHRGGGLGGDHLRTSALEPVPGPTGLRPEGEVADLTGNAQSWTETVISTSTGASSLSLIHISEPTRRTPISYAVFCLKKKKMGLERKS